MSRDRELRERLVEHLVGTHVLTDPAIDVAIRRVPRHLFVPEAALEDAYDDRAIAIKEREGMVISSISQPSMIAQMLALLDVFEGARVLEIGTGSGYNAALLSELAGGDGSVLSVEIENDLIERARSILTLLEYRRVEVADATILQEMHDTFDRIIVTARADDIDQRWWQLLAPHGRIVVPLDIGYGGERAIGLMRDGNYLHSFGSHACAFLEMRTGNRRAQSEVFFRDRGSRFLTPPTAREPLAITAVQRERATPELLANADAVVARPHTLFGIRR